MIGGGDLMGELMSLGSTEAEKLAERFSATTRPHLARILVDAASVEIRRASGEDVTTAAIAVEASLANLALEEKSLAIAAGRDLALRASLALIGKLLGAP